MGYQHVVAVLWYWSLLYIQWAYTTSMEESQRGTVHPADVQQAVGLLASKLAATPAELWSMEHYALTGTTVGIQQ